MKNHEYNKKRSGNSVFLVNVPVGLVNRKQMFVVLAVYVLVSWVEGENFHLGTQISSNEANAFDQIGNVQIKFLQIVSEQLVNS